MSTTQDKKDAERYRFILSKVSSETAWDRWQGFMWRLHIHDPKSKGFTAAIDEEMKRAQPKEDRQPKERQANGPTKDDARAKAVALEASSIESRNLRGRIRGRPIW